MALATREGGSPISALPTVPCGHVGQQCQPASALKKIKSRIFATSDVIFKTLCWPNNTHLRMSPFKPQLLLSCLSMAHRSAQRQGRLCRAKESKGLLGRGTRITWSTRSLVRSWLATGPQCAHLPNEDKNSPPVAGDKTSVEAPCMTTGSAGMCRNTERGREGRRVGGTHKGWVIDYWELPALAIYTKALRNHKRN